MALLGEVPKLNLRTYKGRARAFSFTLEDGDGEVLDLTGYTFTLTAYSLPITADGAVAGDVVLTATAPDLVVTSPASAGEVEWTFSTADSAALAMGTYGFELAAAVGGEVYAAMVGNLYHANTGTGVDPT